MEKPCKLATKATYSYSWAIDVVKELRGRYARAAEILASVYGIDTPELVELLARNRPEYAVIRDIIHTIDRWLLKCGSDKLIAYLTNSTTQTFSSLLYISIKTGDQVSLSILTRYRRLLKLEEQGFLGGEPGSAPRRSRSPSLSNPPKAFSRAMYDEFDESRQGRLF